MLREEADVDVIYQVVIFGDQGVGKTALLNSLTGKKFQEVMFPTHGIDFIRKVFEVDGALIQLMIWDSPGHEQLRSITMQHYKDAQGLILVYDVTNEASFESLKYWIYSVQCHMSKPKGHYEPTPIIVCGNKSDLLMNKKVSYAKGQKFSDKEMTFGFYEASAKTGENVHAIFQSLVYHITDICNPELMTSYHPYSIRPVSKPDMAFTSVARLREFKDKKKVKDTPQDRAEVRVKLEKRTDHYAKCRINTSNFNSVTRSDSGINTNTQVVSEKVDKNMKRKTFRWCLCFGRRYMSNNFRHKAR